MKIITKGQPRAGATGIFSVISMVTHRAVMFISGLIVVRSIGAANYGLFVLARDLCQLANLFSKVGLDLGLVRWLPERRDRPELVLGILKRGLMTTGLLSGSIVAITWLGGGEMLQRYVYKHDNFADILMILVLMLPAMSLMQVLGGAFRGVMQVRVRVVADTLVQPLSRILLILAFFYFSVSLWSVVWATVLSFVIALTFLVYHARKVFSLNGTISKHPIRSDFIKLLKYSLFTSGTLAVALLLQKTDILMLGYLGQTVDVGRYAVIQLAVPLIVIFNNAFGQQLAPLITRLAAEGKRVEMEASMRQHMRWMAIASVPIYSVFVALGPDLLRIFGSDYEIDSLAVVFLASAQLVVALFSSNGYLLSMTNSYRKELPVLGIALAINIALNYLWIPVYGLSGAGAATFSALVIANLVRLYIVHTVHKIWVIGQGILWPIILSYLLMGSIWLVRFEIEDQTVIGAIIAAGIFLVLYGLILARYGLTEADRDIVDRLKKRISKSG